jgi:glutathione S-transferase
MIKLYGFPLSNYYNKVKFALLVKNIAFEEILVDLKTDKISQFSPLGKVPFIVTEQGPLAESQVIMDYLESLKPSLVPQDAFQAAKCREFITFLEMHVELTVREFYGEAFFKQPPLSQANKERLAKKLDKNIKAMLALGNFKPFAWGDKFSMADYSAYVHLPLVGQASLAALGEDYLLKNGLDWKAYLKQFAERPEMIKVNTDKKAYMASKM